MSNVLYKLIYNQYCILILTIVNIGYIIIVYYNKGDECMVKILVLSYLSIKETHGYEIQKYISLTGLDAWTKIKSGSIYYALNKLEKNKEIELTKVENVGSRARRIYKITDKGREALTKEIKEVLGKGIYPIGSEKFILPLYLDKLSKEEGIAIINSHIDNLEKELEYWKQWNDIKVNEGSNDVIRLSFEMTISNLEYSVRWHKALIKEYDKYILEASKQNEIIKSFNFEEINEEDSIGSKNVDEAKLAVLKEKMLNNPDKFNETLEEILKLFNK